MKRLLALLLAIASSAHGDKLAVIMLDGFRWDYLDILDQTQIPNLKSLVQTGFRTEYVQPGFPVVSAPSWTTIVTGTF